MAFMLVVTICSLIINTKTQIGLITKGGADWGPYVQAILGVLLVIPLALFGTVTAIMVPGFILMDKVPVGRAIMLVVWVGHIFYFGFKVQTITQQEADDAMAQALEE